MAVHQPAIPVVLVERSLVTVVVMAVLVVAETGQLRKQVAVAVLVDIVAMAVRAATALIMLPAVQALAVVVAVGVVAELLILEGKGYKKVKITLLNSIIGGK